MGKLKVSQFNTFVKEEDGTYLAFNSLVGGFATLTEQDNKAAREIFEKAARGNLLEENDNGELARSLSHGRFLIPETFDEMGFLKIKNRMRRFSFSGLGLTIAPTMACNFDCPYCFEDRKSGKMTEEVVKSLVSFVESKIKDIKTLDVTWFGGEPLLAMDVVNTLSREFRRLCADHHCEYSASIITNGYALTPAVIKQFSELKIGFVQVTIDGPPEIHDKRRTLRNGAPTLAVILRNLKALVDGTDNIGIGIRVNVDRGSIERAPEVYEMLGSAGLSAKVSISFGLVEPTYACSRFEDACLTRKEFAEFEIRMLKRQLDENMKNRLHFFPTPVSHYCTADLYGGVVVGPTGHLYKCWNDMNRIEESIGRLEDGKVFQEDRLIKWLAWDPTEDEECKKCNLLPVCLGGCPFVRFTRKERGLESSCDERLKVNFVERLRLRYRYRDRFGRPSQQPASDR